MPLTLYNNNTIYLYLFEHPDGSAVDKAGNSEKDKMEQAQGPKEIIQNGRQK